MNAPDRTLHTEGNSDKNSPGSKSDTKVLSLGFIAIVIGILFFLLVIGWYVYWFWDSPVSSDPAEWGVFGDYIGGVVNPLLGLVTICLLTASLHQNNKMLQKAEEELVLARQEIARGIRIQEDTKESLVIQNRLAQEIKDFETAYSLLKNYNEYIDQMSIHKKTEKTPNDMEIIARTNYLFDYVSFHFKEIVERAFRNGYEPDKHFTKDEFIWNRNRVEMYAYRSQRFVSIIVTLLNNKQVSFYWIDSEGEINDADEYLKQLNDMFKLAKVSVTKLFVQAPKLANGDFRDLATSVQDHYPLSLDPPKIP